MSGDPGRVRLTDVAAAANVHTGTASRALSRDPQIANAVSPDTRARVRAAALMLGYRANFAGRALRTGRSGMVGLLMPQVSDNAMSSFYEGMLGEAERHQMTVVVVSTGDSPERRNRCIIDLLELGVDGILYTDAHLDEHVPDFGAVPVLPAYRSSRGEPAVAIDDLAGGAVVADHLLDCGHETFVVLGGYAHASTTRSRVDGFLGRLRERGIDTDAAVTVEWTDLQAASGRAVTGRLLDAGDRPDALFAVDDMLAVGAVAAAMQHDLRPGRDIAVVGYNDRPLVRELAVPLSSVAVDLEALGAAAFTSLLGVIAGGAPVQQRHTPNLHVRLSSNCVT